MLGSKAIIHGGDDAPSRIGEVAAEAVVGIEIADDTAAAMEVDEPRKELAGGRRCATV